MSFTITKAVFMEEIDPWDEGPHTIYEVCYNGTDFTTFYLKTRAGRWLKLFSAGSNMLSAIHSANKDVTKEEFSEVMAKHNEFGSVSDEHGVPVAEPPVGLSAVSPASAPEDAAAIPHANEREAYMSFAETGPRGDRLVLPVPSRNEFGEHGLCEYILDARTGWAMLYRLQTAMVTLEKRGNSPGPPAPPPDCIIQEGKAPRPPKNK